MDFLHSTSLTLLDILSSESQPSYLSYILSGFPYSLPSGQIFLVYAPVYFLSYVECPLGTTSEFNFSHWRIIIIYTRLKDFLYILQRKSPLDHFLI